ncbi:MAG: hypothetical protein ACI4HJ_06435 [Ruminococcus sp.]|nr:hypothetical protein [Oscillospiraceae bacterium]
MALSRSKIDGYMIPTVKGKYYEKGVVDALLMDIANDADETLTELSSARRRVNELEKREESIAQALVIVRELSEQILSKAKAEAEKIIMESTAKQLEIEQEIARLENLKSAYREDLETEIKNLMADLLTKVKSE